MLLSDLLTQKEKINQVADFDAIATNGIKRGSGATGAPVATGSWFVQTMIMDASSAVQTAYGYAGNDGVTTSRVKTGGVWGGWVAAGGGGGGSQALADMVNPVGSATLLSTGAKPWGIANVSGGVYVVVYYQSAATAGTYIRAFSVNTDGAVTLGTAVLLSSITNQPQYTATGISCSGTTGVVSYDSGSVKAFTVNPGTLAVSVGATAVNATTGNCRVLMLTPTSGVVLYGSRAPGTCFAFSVAGTTITAGANVSVNTAGYYSGLKKISDTSFLVYGEYSGGYAAVGVGSVSGVTVTFGGIVFVNEFTTVYGVDAEYINGFIYLFSVCFYSNGAELTRINRCTSFSLSGSTLSQVSGFKNAASVKSPSAVKTILIKSGSGKLHAISLDYNNSETMDPELLYDGLFDEWNVFSGNGDCFDRATLNLPPFKSRYFFLGETTAFSLLPVLKAKKVSSGAATPLFIEFFKFPKDI